MAPGFQPPTGLADKDRASVIKAIGRERFATYLAATATEARALQLYELNGRLSAQMHEVIGGFEVALRNAIAQSIENYYDRSDWFRCRDFAMRLSPERRQNIREVRQRLSSEGRDQRPGRIVAGLSFHFWVALHENKYRDTIWTPHLHRIWPKGTDIKLVHKDLLKFRDLRNRIAHHEPVFHTRWHGRMEQLWLRFGQISPEKSSWYRARCGPAILDLGEACQSLQVQGGI